MLKKNNLNAMHDGVIIKCPVEKKEEGFIYQRILNNIYDDKSVWHFRTPIIKDIIPFVYLKLKKTEERFTEIVYKAFLEETGKYFSDDEAEKIILVCSELGLD